MDDSFEEVVLDMLGEWEAHALDFTMGDMEVSFSIEQRPDMVFTLIAEKKEIFDEQQRNMLN